MSTFTLHHLHKVLMENYGYYILVIPTVTSAWTYKSIRITSKVDEGAIVGLSSVSDLPPYTEVSGVDYPAYEDALRAGIGDVMSLLGVHVP